MSETRPDPEAEARFLKAIGKALGTPANVVPNQKKKPEKKTSKAPKPKRGRSALSRKRNA